MQILALTDEVKKSVSAYRRQGKSVGLVPTMGALHQGHISLIRQALRENDMTAVSIFVNPTQFNEQQDFDTYPRNKTEDTALLKELDCDILFVPSVSEIYPEQDTRVFDLGGLDRTMEGRHRPGHFNGVAQVVTKLLDIFRPDRAYFGQKDFQQLAVIRYLCKQVGIPVEIVSCPIVREADGLAMSSRNRLLTPAERKLASLIPQNMMMAASKYPGQTPGEIKSFVKAAFNALPGATLEYFEIVDHDSLKSVERWDQSDNPVACIAVRIGNVRLIDNLKYS